jgi:glutamate racemase
MLHPDDEHFSSEIAAKIGPLLDAGADQIVLGCTHYSFIAPQLRRFVNGRAEIVDVADAVARQVVRLASGEAQGNALLRLEASAHAERLHAALPRLGLHWLAERAAPAL